MLHKRLRTYAVGIVTVLASLGTLAVAGPSASAASGPVLTAAPGNGPYDSQTQFCAKTTAPSGKRNSNSPGVTPTSITLGEMSVDAVPLKRLGISVIDFHSVFQVFVNEINKCGGVNGRKLILKPALYNLLAPDLTGHIQASCLKLTEDAKSFMVVGIGMPLSVIRCIGVQHKSILDSPANATEAEFKDSKGRIVSQYPSSDGLAAAYIADGAAQHSFDGKKITVLGTTAQGPQFTALMRSQFIDGFKKLGIDAELEMLPCQGSICVQNIGSAVRRMKQNGTTLVVLTPTITNTSLGQLFREIRAQGVQATFSGPTFGSSTADTQIPAIVSNGGADAVSYVDQVGWIDVGTDKLGEWRDGKIKESTLGHTCNQVAAKALNQAPYQFVEKDIVSSGWGATASICQTIRAVARALYSLGNNVTTERMSAALSKVKAERRDTGPIARDLYYYSGTDNKPTKVIAVRFRYPCPLPLPRPATPAGCFTPVDSPLRFRTVKY